MNFPYPLILASKSPRRRQLLQEAGFTFTIKTKEVNEDYPNTINAHEVAAFLAAKKAKAFKAELKNEVVITADTTVVIDDDVLGKAPNDHAAFEMLRRLSGKLHKVISGVCLFSQEKEIVFSETTEVHFKELTDEEINYYIQNFEPFDKAGAYGIQEWIGMVGIDKIIGDYYNVVGLPVGRVYRELVKW